MKKINLLAVIAMAGSSIFALTATSFAGETNPTEMAAKEMKAEVYTEVNAADLQAMQQEGDLVILDTRKAEEFAEGHIPDAIALRPNDITPEKLAEIAPTKDTKLLFYCGSVQCPASAKAAHKAAEAGYTKLYKYPGGMADWKEQGLPVNNS